MQIKPLLTVSALALALGTAAPAIAATAQANAPIAAADTAVPAELTALVDQVDIPFEKFTLDNGLDVIVHTDRKAPIVAVAVWYNVGSKDEPQGKSGFAHLFEHLMFNGSENAPQDYFQYLQEMGATDYNGTTNFDRTNYFQTVPRPALERALWLESDRMGYLLGAVTQQKLDNQRGVVQNEKRQGDNQPGGLVFYEIVKALFPAPHPYDHTPIGSATAPAWTTSAAGSATNTVPTTPPWCWRATCRLKKRGRWSRNISARSRAARSTTRPKPPSPSLPKTSAR